VFEDEKSVDAALSPKSPFKIKDSILKVEKRLKNNNKKPFHKRRDGETKENKEPKETKETKEKK